MASEQTPSLEAPGDRAPDGAPRRTGGWTDPRWEYVRGCVAAIPEGRWTAYQDLADLTGFSAQSIGSYLSSHPVPGAHRVLRASGQISPDFRWPDPNRTDDPREMLTAEGVDFADREKAAPGQRITAEDLRGFLPPSPGGRRTWLVRGSAVLGTNVVGQWLAEGFVSLAASHLRPVAPDIDPEELRAAVEADYAHLSYNQRKVKRTELLSFLIRMHPGDVVTTTSEGQMFTGRIEGDARYSDANDPRTTIRRNVTWNDVGIDFTDLPPALAARLRSSATVLDLTETADTVWNLVEPGDREQEGFPEDHREDLDLRTAQTTEAAQGRARERLRPRTFPFRVPDRVVQDLLVAPEWLAEFVDLLRARRQVILHGPPGTGKTYLALAVAEALTDAANVTLVQFHPAYSYEDFFEGYRPTTVDDSGRVGFALAPGPLRKLVDRAREDPTTPYILVIDEINRANLAKVFGELYFLLEYRDRAIDLMYSSGDEGRDFTLPENVHLIGTMNTADRSITALDSAMRRRFAFLSLHPDDPHLRGVLRAWLTRRNLPVLAADLLDELNRRLPDRDTRIGPSYLMNQDAGTDAGLERIWRTSILPLLAELHDDGDPDDLSRRLGLTALRRAVTSRSRTGSGDGAGTGG